MSLPRYNDWFKPDSFPTLPGIERFRDPDEDRRVAEERDARTRATAEREALLAQSRQQLDQHWENSLARYDQRAAKTKRDTPRSSPMATHKAVDALAPLGTS